MTPRTVPQSTIRLAPHRVDALLDLFRAARDNADGRLREARSSEWAVGESKGFPIRVLTADVIAQIGVLASLEHRALPNELVDAAIESANIGLAALTWHLYDHGLTTIGNASAGEGA